MASRDIAQEVRTTLLSHWDPIGISDEPRAQDEYDSYVPAIVRLIGDRVSADALARQLLAIERERMGLPGDEAVARRAARALLAIARE